MNCSSVRREVGIALTFQKCAAASLKVPSGGSLCPPGVVPPELFSSVSLLLTSLEARPATPVCSSPAWIWPTLRIAMRL